MAPYALEKVPALQAKHGCDISNADDHVPGVHGVHTNDNVAEPTEDHVPALQRTHVEISVAPKADDHVPTLQPRHV